MLTRAQFLTSLFAVTVCTGCGASMAQPGARGKVRANLYACDNCEAAFRGHDLATLTDWRTTIAGANEPGERLNVRGVIYETDGKTPAKDVVLFAYHTDATGIYAPRGQRPRLRGWMRTGADGRYEFDTIKPAPYPARTMPAHIHMYVLEPGRRVYYIDDIVFAGEFKVDAEYHAKQELRGGSGIVSLSRHNGAWGAARDIVLEPHPA